MEAHTVKHPAFHHLHQASPQANHLANHISHNSLSTSVNTSSTSQPFAFGSNQSQGSSQQSSSASKLNFESSTAFPLLLSSISSESGLSGVGGVNSNVGGAGRSNAFSTPKPGVSFSRSSTSKGSSTFASLSTSLHNAATGNLSNHSASSQHLSNQSGSQSLAQQFTSVQFGAGKHKHSSTATAGPPADQQQFTLSGSSNISSHPLTNGIVKGTPKPKTSAPPNQLATFGPSTPNGRGHHQQQLQQLHLHGAKSTPGQQYLTDGGAVISATLPFKKNLLSRETSLNNNGTSSSRSKGTPNKENNKGSTLASGAQPPATALSAAAPIAAIALAPTSGVATVSTVARKVSSNRSPTRVPGPKSTVNNDSNISSNNGSSGSSASQHSQHNLHNHVLVNGTASPQLPVLDLSLETINFVASNPNVVLSPSSFTSKQKPKEFKFFKEKAKDKQQQKNSAASGANNGCKDAQQSLTKSTSKSTSKAKSATISSTSGGSGTVKKVNKGTKTDKSSGLLGKTKNNNNSSTNLEVTKNRKQSSSTVSTVSVLSGNGATLFGKDGAENVLGEQRAEALFSERIIYFSESIIDGFAIQCFTDQESLELSLQDAVKHDLPVLHNFATSSSSTTATSAAATTTTTSPSTGNSLQHHHHHPTPTSSLRPTIIGKRDVDGQQCLVGEARVPNVEGPKKHSTSVPPSSSTLTSLHSFHQPQPLVSALSVRIIFEQREALPFHTSESNSSTAHSNSKSPLAPNKRGPSLVSPTRRPRKQSLNKNSNTSKSKKTTATSSKTSKKPMAKDSKSKKVKPTGKAKKEVVSDSEDSDEEELDEDRDADEEVDDEDGEEVSKVKASHKSKFKVKATKCTHKHPRTQTACNRCLLLQTQKKQKNAAGKKKQTKTKVSNKKVKASKVSSKITKDNKKPAKMPKKKATSVSSKSAKGPKSKKTIFSDEEDSFEEDQSDDEDDDDEAEEEEEEDDDDDNSDSASDEESDATQEDEEDDNEDSSDDQSDQSGCEGSKRTIADLIKCCNRREAVRKAAERAALQSVNARSKTNRSGATSATSSSTEASAVSSVTTSGPPATTTSDNADVDLSSGKNSKIKKMPNKSKSPSAASTTAKGKRSASNKRSQSDNSSNEEDEESLESEEEEEEETEPLTSPRRGRNYAKKVPKATKSAKRPKIEVSHEDELEDEEASDGSESDVSELPSAFSKKAPKRSTARSKASNKQQIKLKKSFPTKKIKCGKGMKAKKEADSEEDEEEKDEEENANLTDHGDEEPAEQNLTDAEMEDEEAEKGVEKTKKQTTGRGGQQKKATGKSTRASPSKAGGSNKGKTSKSENKTSSGKKSGVTKVASKKSANDESDEDTEQSEQDEGISALAEEEKKKDFAEQQQTKQRQSASHGKSSSANTKNKCDKSKAKASAAGNASSSTSACPVKDVYTFELSPVEVPCANASFVLSSGQENKARVEEQGKTEQSESSSMAANVSLAVPAEAGNPANLSTVVKSSFSPQIVSGSSSSPSSSSVNRDGPAFEPLRPDSYSLYESSYGPNVSLSSLSQLSQSIGGGAGGPILLNHQQQSSLSSASSMANSKCSINIKEEPRDDSLQSPFRVAHPKASSTIHQTPPPVIGDHHSASQNYGASFGSSVNNKATHPRRLWSNASAGSLISSSSSSSSSPVQLAFGQCPPGQPPTPATPASLASYFTPSSSLPALSSPFYPPNSQDLIRRDLDSRILASTAADRNLLSASMGMAQSVGAAVQQPQPQPPPQQHQQHQHQSLAQTPFNHAPTSPMIPPVPTTATNSLLVAPCSSASFMPSGSPYPLPPHLQNNQATFTPCVPNRSTNQVPDLSAESPLRINSPSSRSQSPREKASMTSLKKGRWGSMHITIAHNIQNRQMALMGRSHSLPITATNNSSTATTSLPKSTPISSHTHNRPSSKGSVKTFEPHAIPHSVYAASVSSPAKGVATASLSSKSSQDAASTVLVHSMRPASVASSTFNTNNYPPRFGTPTFGPPSMSAPPMLPGLFPSPIPSPMNFPGFLTDSWARPPLPGTIPPPPTTPSAAGAATRPSVPFTFADYYNNANSASSFLSAFAAGARPPGEAFFGSQSKQTTSESNNKAPASANNSSSSNGGGSHKRKHENHDHGKERVHSSKHQNGLEKSSSHKKSKQTKYDSSSSASRTSAIENGERSRTEMQNDFYNRKSTSHEPTRHSTPNFNLAISSAASSSPYTSPFFSGSHKSYPPAPSPSASEHQRYMEMMSISTALATGLPPPPLPPSSSATNAFLSQSSYNPASSRSLWPYGHLPPPGPHASPSSLMGSSMMSDPFKSLTDISLRPGMVSHDRETLFSRYSLLNSSGGGASIFDKMSKEQLEKIDMLQGQGKPSQATTTATGSAGSGSIRTSSEPTLSTSSRSTPTHRLHTAPPPAALPSLPPPLPLPPASTSTAIAPPTASSTPFPYGYLSPLNPFGAAGAGTYLPQAPPLGHPSPFSASSAMLNGVDPITSLALSHHHHHHPGSMPPLPPGLSADQAQFLLPPPFGVPPPGSSAANMMNSFLKGNPSSR